MALNMTFDEQNRAAAEKNVTRRYRDVVISQNAALHAVGRMSKTFLGRTVIGVFSVAVGGAIALVAAPGIAILGGGISAALLVAHSRNQERKFEYLVADTIAEKRKSGAFDHAAHVEMVMMTEHRMRLMAELGRPGLSDIALPAKNVNAGAAFNNSTSRSRHTGMPLTGGSPDVLAAMRAR